MKFDLFFAGMQNKETTSSAWLGTMLRDDPAFRRAFFAAVRTRPPLDPDEPWAVDIETPMGNGACDVTLKGDTAFVFIENKVSRSALTERQFLRYYEGALGIPAFVGTRRAVGIYLGPTKSIGVAETAALQSSPSFIDRRARGYLDDAICLGWKEELAEVTKAMPQDNWFAYEGLDAILNHISTLERGRPFDEQRERLRRLMARVGERVMRAAEPSSESGAPPRVVRWPSHGQEALYTPGQAITTWLTLRYAESDDEESRVLNVFLDELVHVRARISFNPSTRIGLRDPELMSRWNALIEKRVIELAGIGDLQAHDEVAFELVDATPRTESALEDLLVAWGTSALAFLKSFDRPARRAGSPG